MTGAGRREYRATVAVRDGRELTLTAPAGNPDAVTLWYEAGGGEREIDLYCHAAEIAQAIREAIRTGAGVAAEDAGGAPLTIGCWGAYGGAVIHGRPQDPPGDEQAEFTLEKFGRLAALLETPPREWAAAVGPGAVRTRCGIPLQAVARGAGVTVTTVWRWESGARDAAGEAGARYRRIIDGLARHLEVDELPGGTLGGARAGRPRRRGSGSGRGVARGDPP